MTRVIKFRAWDGNEMNTAFDLSQNPKYWWEGNKDFPLMQYTGLKDKNGVEIYEGDILQGDFYPITSSDGYVLVVEYDKDRFWGVRCLKAGSTVRGISDGIADGLWEFADEGLEIIGNIHGNPELLEVAQ